jgi:hypothetical protein
VDWYFFAGIAAGAVALLARATTRRSGQAAAATASGLHAAPDLTHLPQALQRTALWSLADGGFESRVVHGTVSRARTDIAVTAFDLETLRERRGEWAWLPVEPPFRIAGLVSVVVCEVPGRQPHALFKRAGHGDAMLDDNRVDRAAHIAKNVRDRLGVPRSYEAEMPALPSTPLDVPLPEGWRVYGRAPESIGQLLAAGLGKTLERASRRDLVIELLDELVVVYPAARDVSGADAFADLTTTAIDVAEGVVASSARVTPRGVEPTA